MSPSKKEGTPAAFPCTAERRAGNQGSGSAGRSRGPRGGQRTGHENISGKGGMELFRKGGGGIPKNGGDNSKWGDRFHFPTV